MFTQKLSSRHTVRNVRSSYQTGTWKEYVLIVKNQPEVMSVIRDVGNTWNRVKFLNPHVKYADTRQNTGSRNIAFSG
jgi:hypothetical protein